MGNWRENPKGIKKNKNELAKITKIIIKEKGWNEANCKAIVWRLESGKPGFFRSKTFKVIILQRQRWKLLQFRTSDGMKRCRRDDRAGFRRESSWGSSLFLPPLSLWCGHNPTMGRRCEIWIFMSNLIGLCWPGMRFSLSNASTSPETPQYRRANAVMKLLLLKQLC